MADTPSFNQAIADGLEVVQRCRAIQPKPWNAEGSMIELVKQVGDLARHVMVAEGYYTERDNADRYSGGQSRIADELVDIFTAIVRLADHYDIDLVSAVEQTRQAEDQWLKSKGV